MINVHLYPSPFLNESRILRVARSLAKLRLFDSIDLLGTGGDGLVPEESIGDGIRIRRFGERSESAGLLGKVLHALRWSAGIYVQYRRAPVSCINCHSVSTLPLACALKWSTGARLVYDAHELETETSGLSGIRKIGTKLVERALIGYSDYSVFVAAAIDDWYRETYGLENTAVIYNCPAFARIEPTNVFRRSFPIAPDVPIFLYQGVLSQARGIVKLVEAFRHLDDVALVIMGYGELRDWVARAVGQQENLFLHSAVPPDELLAYTAAADFGLSVIESTSLSYEFCMPNKLFEYLMARKPVLVSPTREQRRLVEQYGVGVVLKDTTIDAIQMGVRDLLAKDLPAMQAAIDVVRMEYSWQQQETKLREIYQNRLRLQSSAAVVPQ